MNGHVVINSSGGLEALESLPTVAASKFMNWRPDAVNNSGPTGVPVPYSLSTAEERFLRAVMEHPGRPSSGYPALAGIGTHQGIAARKRLLEAGLLREHRIQAKGRGRTSVILEVTSKALAMFGR